MVTEQTAQTAREEAGAVAGTVKEETKNVAQQAQQQASTALHQVQEDVRTRANDEASKFAQTLHDTSRELRSMADATDGQGLTANVVREGASATERLASQLENGGFDGAMAEARAWARRRPGAFLLGAAAVGFVAGRLVRNMSGDGEASGLAGSASITPPPASTKSDADVTTTATDGGSAQ